VQLKRLGIVSDCVHFITREGDFATYNHVLLRQFEALAMHFEEVVICCPFIEEDCAVYSKYTAVNIKFLKAKPAGGDTFKAKVDIIKKIPGWVSLYRQLNKTSDIVYLRFPNNISIPAFFYFRLMGKKMFATFTGPWDTDSYSSFSTNMQILLLKYFFKGPVWVYSKFENNKPDIIKSYSPSYTEKVWMEESENVSEKIQSFATGKLRCLKMISVGSLNERKNHQYLLQTCVQLKNADIPFELTIAGTGILETELKAFIHENLLGHAVKLAGKVSYNGLRALFRSNDFVVQSPLSEGYGKVPVEGFFHGLIPILSNTSLFANEMTGNNERGFVFDVHDSSSLFKILYSIWNEDTKAWLPAFILNGRDYAKQLTIERWANEYAATVEQYFGKNKL